MSATDAKSLCIPLFILISGGSDFPLQLCIEECESFLCDSTLKSGFGEEGRQKARKLGAERWEAELTGWRKSVHLHTATQEDIGLP